jgi:hypothetical protein
MIGSVGLSHAAEVKTSAGKTSRTALARREKMGVGDVPSMEVSSGFMCRLWALFAGVRFFGRCARPHSAGVIDAAECTTRDHHSDFAESLKNHRCV